MPSRSTLIAMMPWTVCAGFVSTRIQARVHVRKESQPSVPGRAPTRGRACVNHTSRPRPLTFRPCSRRQTLILQIGDFQGESTRYRSSTRFVVSSTRICETTRCSAFMAPRRSPTPVRAIRAPFHSIAKPRCSAKLGWRSDRPRARRGFSSSWAPETMVAGVAF
jgi:hypothetical protein